MAEKRIWWTRELEAVINNTTPGTMRPWPAIVGNATEREKVHGVLSFRWLLLLCCPTPQTSGAESFLLCERVRAIFFFLSFLLRIFGFFIHRKSNKIYFWPLNHKCNAHNSYRKHRLMLPHEHDTHSLRFGAECVKRKKKKEEKCTLEKCSVKKYGRIRMCVCTPIQRVSVCLMCVCAILYARLLAFSMKYR